MFVTIPYWNLKYNLIDYFNKKKSKTIITGYLENNN